MREDWESFRCDIECIEWCNDGGVDKMICKVWKVENKVRRIGKLRKQCKNGRSGMRRLKMLGKKERNSITQVGDYGKKLMVKENNSMGVRRGSLINSLGQGQRWKEILENLREKGEGGKGLVCLADRGKQGADQNRRSISGVVVNIPSYESAGQSSNPGPSS